MKVFVVVESDYDYVVVRGVHSTPESAEATVEKCKKECFYGYYTTEQWEIDGEKCS